MPKSATPASPERGEQLLFAGAGEMRARCRAFDWRSTPLGPVESWPQSLRTTVDIMLASPHPMLLWWGSDLVQIFNDGYLPSFGTAGRDRLALGARGREHWADAWPIVGSEIEAIMAGGPASWHEDQLVPIERNGAIDEVWWTYGLSPVRNEDGSVGGVLVVVRETTSRLLASREQAASVQRLAAVLQDAPAFISIVRGPSMVFELANDSYYDLVGQRDLIGRPLFEAIPEARGQGFEELLRRVMDTGQPVTGTELPLKVRRGDTQELETRYVTFVYAPLFGADGRSTGIFSHGIDVTDHVHARRVLEAARDDAMAARLHTSQLLSLSAALSRAATQEQVAAAVVLHAPAVFGATGAVLARWDANERCIVLVDVVDMPADIRREWTTIDESADVPLVEVVRTRDPIFLESRAEWVKRYPHVSTALEATTHHSNAVAPLIVDDHVVGSMGIAFALPRAFSVEDRALVLTVAAQCARALERAQLFEEAQRARAEAENANRAKSDFLAVMSHELRTPLNAIGGYAELVEMGVYGPVTPEQLTAVARIQQSQRHLLGLINGVLQYAKVDAGAIQFLVTDVSISEVMSTCEALVSPQVSAKQITFESGCSKDLLARADGEKLQQIILNLLSNAIKFTAPGGTVQLTAHGDRGSVEIQVTDTGRGIAADQFERIFQPFVQVDAPLTRLHEGTGLGLAISRDLARAMRGDLTVTSEPGKGSTFTLTLPVA